MVCDRELVFATMRRWFWRGNFQEAGSPLVIYIVVIITGYTLGEYGDNGKENGNYYSILGLYFEKFAQLVEEINTVQALGQNCVLLAGAGR